MIIPAPRTGPMVAGFPLFNVNTLDGGTRYMATVFASERARDTAGKTAGWTKIKRRAAGCWNTTTALAQPAFSALHRPEEKGGQAVQKPRSSLYAMRGRRAVTVPRSPVAISTVSVVAA